MAKEDDLKNELAAVDKEISQLDKAVQKLLNKKQNLISKKQEIKMLIQQNASEKLANQDWEKSDHSWSQRVMDILTSVFKLSTFRPHQLSTINAVMSKQDCILLMPTGGGKSLCYQLPAMLLTGITLVVSPLISLMEDQIMALEALKIPATLLNATSGMKHGNYVHKEMTEKNSALKLLYVTPEKLSKSKRFMTKLQKMYQMGKFSLLAIDEVHCCSQWGHDFRPDYKFLGIMKRQFPNVPILGLTATATSSVINDVQNMLNVPGCLVLRASFNRPNLKYEVCCKSSNQQENIDELERLLKNRFNGLTGIIYCFSIKDSEETASELRKRNIRAKAYHAQLDASFRSAVHKQWASNTIQVIVATVAFGMGIDKPDVRFVIHHSMPKSMENFYQESGRAGRDDQQACCILFYRFADIFRQSTMVFTEKKGLEHIYAMVAYCLDLSRCRRSIIADHFGERWEASDCNKMCDHCEKNNLFEERKMNVLKECQTLYKILNHCNLLEERLTSSKLIDIWQGKGAPKSRPPNHIGTSYSRETCERIVAFLLLESYLMEDFHFTPYSTISYINVGSREAVVSMDDHEIILPFPSSKRKKIESEDTQEKGTSNSHKHASKKSKLSANSHSDASHSGYVKSSNRYSVKSTNSTSVQSSGTSNSAQSPNSNHAKKSELKERTMSESETKAGKATVRRKEIVVYDDDSDFDVMEHKTKVMNTKKSPVPTVTVSSDSD